MTFLRLPAAPPAVVSSPVWRMLARNSVGEVPSPVAGKDWANDQLSTAAYAVPFHCWVVMPASWAVDQKLGPDTRHAPPLAQFRS